MPQIIPIKDLKNTAEIIEISEKQLKTGQIKDARDALAKMRAKYGL